MGWPGKSVSWTALPAAVTLMTDTTLSVGLPSLSASTQVPASFFSRSRPACVAGSLAGLGLVVAAGHGAEGEEHQAADQEPSRHVVLPRESRHRIRPAEGGRYTTVLYRHGACGS